MRFLTVAVCLWLAGTALAAGDLFAPAIEQADLDLAATATWVDGEVVALDRAAALRALELVKVNNFTEHFWRPWAIGRVEGARAGSETSVCQFRLAFTRPLTIGSILCTNQQLALLKPEAPYPGDPANPEHWQRVTMPAYQRGLRLVALPPGTSTRAILLGDTIRGGRATAYPVRLYQRRLHSIAWEAGARALTEYHAPRNFGERSYRAVDVVRGRGPWLSNGRNDDGRVVGPFISDLQPTWFALGWPEPRPIHGLVAIDNFAQMAFDRFTGAEGVDPLVATEAEWTKVKEREVAANRVFVRPDLGRWVQFTEPIVSRGLRLRILKTTDPQGKDSQVAELHSLLVVTDLGEAPAPEVRWRRAIPPPVSVNYELASDALVTIAIDDAAGKRVRNLIARVPRQAGPNTEAWDLKDDGGQAVPPGDYRWRAIYHSPLRLNYEFSVYPNVSVHHPENTAWLNGHSGPGGWLADHSPPFGGTAAGDYLFFTAPVPESGVGFVCTDLTGKKLWGIHSFGAWSGGRRVAADGGTVYVEQYGFYKDDAGSDRIWAVDIATQQVRDLFAAKSDARRKRGAAGIAARDGKVYFSVNADEDWIANAAGVAAIDIERCVPFYKEPRKPLRPYEIVPDPRGDFLRLIRVTGDPPGYAPDHGLTYLESTRGPDNRQWIMIAFNRPVSLGGCVLPVPQTKDYRVKLSVLKADAPYPPNPETKAQWQDFARQPTLPWDIALAPENCTTRALLITFYKGEDDAMADLMGDEFASGPAWEGRLEGIQILRRRYRNHYDSAKVTVSSGAVDRMGVWIAERTTPLSEADPEVFLMQWDEAKRLRGLAIKEIDCKRTEVDVWTGPPGDTPLMADSTHWERVGSYVPRRRMEHPGFAGHNAHALYMNDAVDFGREIETRAVRLRVVEQWLTETREGSCAKDMLQIDPTRCRLFGVAPLEYIGGEVPVEALATERLEIIDGKSGKVEREIAIGKPGDLDFAPDGSLYAIAGKQVVRVNLDGGAHTPVVTDLLKPLSIGIDRGGLLYVFDADTKRRNIRVYDHTGALQRTIGKPGGYQVGPWDPERLQSVTAIAIDRQDQLWATDQTYWPKRVSCWGIDGSFRREYLGPTEYGSGGVLDPEDKRRLFYGPLEFELDWERGTSRLKNLTWPSEDGRAAGEVPIRIGDRCYLVTRPSGSHHTANSAIVYLYENDRLRRVAAMGYAEDFGPLREKEFQATLGSRVLTDFQFLWMDANGDGRVQAAEVTLSEERLPQVTHFNRDLGIQAGSWRYTVTGFDERGVPRYELQRAVAGNQGPLYRLDNGLYYARGDGSPDAWRQADGKPLATYPNDGAGVGPDRTCPPYTPAQVVCQFYLTGHETAAGGDLGEFFVYNSNLGSWNIWTADGLLAGRIFRDLRDPERLPWTMLENDRGMDLSDVTAGQEHFQGYFCRTADGKYYVVAGHNHASLVEVQGLDDFRRLEGQLEVTPEAMRQTLDWERQVVRAKAAESAKVIYGVRAPEAVIPDGSLAEWQQVPVNRLDTDRDDILFRLSYNEQGLCAAWEVNGKGPMKNGGNQWDQLFKTGAAVDLQIAADPAADPARRAPVEGDKRVLMTCWRDGYIAVLYDAVVPGTPRDKAWVAQSPVARVEFDVVRRLETVKMGSADTGHGYIFEAVIPWKELGIEVRPELRLKLDWGILEGGQDGTSVLARTYWANKATSVLADVPSEARLEPDLWGYAIFGVRGAPGAPGSPKLPGSLDDDPAQDFQLEED